MLEQGTSLTVGSHKVDVVRYLSEGGFSKIYEVRMELEGGKDQIACLKQVLVRDKAGLATLRKEVDVMKNLRKARSIVRYYDSNAETLPDGTIQVLVLMELCPNNSLLHYMNDRIRQKLTEQEILKIMLDISIGIYEMHKLNLVHRDIKIENVLIDANNRFKLCDFGSVSSPIRPPKDQQEFQMLSHDILYQTTPQYRAPEMIDLYRGLPIDERSDIWAFGCFLYKLCYYTTPFEASGDIAILHASFQFLPSPAFSGDLKNLIIIMLQENPIYRPNIVQIIMLLAKMMQKDFDKLLVEDFYQRGPYDFQALHEMQKQKQNEQLKRQQYYYEQQLQQQKYENQQKQSISTSSSQSHLQQLPGQNTSHSSKSASHESEFNEGRKSLEVHRSNSRPDSVKSTTTTTSSIDVGPSNQIKVPDVKLAPPADAQNAQEADVFTEDFSDFDNVAERYPSLDAIDHAGLTKSGKTSANDLDKISQHSSDHVSSNKYSDLAKVNSRPTVLENAEAWQKIPSASIDKDAEKLVEGIFVQGTTEQVPPSRSELYLNKPTSSRSSKSADSSNPSIAEKSPDLWKQDPIQKMSENPAHPIEPIKSQEDKHGKTAFDYFNQEKNVAKNPKVRQEVPPQLPIIKNRTPDSSYYQATSHASTHDSQNYLQVAQPEMRRENSNPWGNALDTLPQHSAHKDRNTQNPIQSDLNAQVASLSLNEAKAPQKESKDLIDFDDADIQNHGAMALGKTIAAPLVDTEVSLLDMEHENLRNYSDGKPKFKKRLSMMQPQQLEFQEQVIDFASDDENNNSQMSRVSIRNSLKKSRKTSDHGRRSDSSHGESKKRLSFFGNTD